MDHAQRTVTLSRGKGKGLFRSIFPAFFFTLLLGAFLLAVGALALSRLPDPSRSIRLLGPILPAFCAFFGGFVAGKREKNMGAVAGLSTGLLFLLVLISVSTFTGGSMTLPTRILCYTLLLLLSVLGGAAGSAGGVKKRHRHKKR